MKKFFAVLAVFALVLAACPTDDGKGNGGGNAATTLRIKNQSSKTISDVVWNNVSFFGKENADVIGTWTGSSGTQLNIITVTLVISGNIWTMTMEGWGSDGDNGGTWTRKGNNFTFTSNSPIGNNGTASLSGGILTYQVRNFVNGALTATYQLTSNDLDNSITSGINVTKPVEDGSGYIFFKVGGTAYRTNDLIVVEKGKNTEFTFTNSTLVVETNGSSTPVTLGEL